MYEALQPAISPNVIESLFAIAIGFAVAGLCASGYRLFGMHFPSFRLLEVGPMAGALCRGSGADVLRPVPHHAQHVARAPHRAAPRRIRHDRHRDRRTVEPDVRNGRGDGASSAAERLIVIPGSPRLQVDCC